MKNHNFGLNDARLKSEGVIKRLLGGKRLHCDCVATQNIISFSALPIVSFSLILIFGKAESRIH